MRTEEIIEYIYSSKKRTLAKCYLRTKKPIEFSKQISVFGDERLYVLFGEYQQIAAELQDFQEDILEIKYEISCVNSAIPLKDIKDCEARIEPGAILREQVELGKGAIIMMGAILNIGAQVGEGSMIDMGAVLGGRAIVGKNCHIGANAVLAGVIEPASALPVVVEDDVLVGANAVILEGVRIGKGAVVAAGAVVTEDVLPGMVVAGIPAKVIKKKDEKTIRKTGIVENLRSL